MKRTTFAGLLAVLLAILGAGIAGAASPPRARLRAFICQTALSPLQRAVSVTAVMRPVSGTETMALRFVLLSDASAVGSFAPVRSGNLGAWLSPAGQPTLGSKPADVWRVTAPVAVLPAPAAYSYRVTFRWTGANGHVLLARTLRSGTCFQPELRPDLLVQAILPPQPIMGQPQPGQYTVVIRNAGATAAGAFRLVFAPGGGAPTQTSVVPGLAPHASRSEVFQGPACAAAAAPTATVDPNQQVQDVTRANNSLSAICPAVTGPPAGAAGTERRLARLVRP